jgi:CRP/FNR family nitrogen fixation transcriptional regulator
MGQSANAAVAASGAAKGPRPFINYPKDCVIYDQGAQAQAWFRILNGVVRTCRYFSNGNRQITGFFFQGQVFGVEDQVYRATAEAVTDVIVVRQERSRLAEPANDRRTLTIALEEAEARVELLGLKGAHARIAGFLLAIAALDKDEGCGCGLPMHRADIADYLAIDVATVSRILSQFQRQGLLSLQGRRRCRIRDAARLRAIVAGDPHQPRRGA